MKLLDKEARSANNVLYTQKSSDIEQYLEQQGSFKKQVSTDFLDGVYRALSPKEVAEYLGVHHKTVLKMLRTGRLKGIKVGRTWRIRPSDVTMLWEHENL